MKRFMLFAATVLLLALTGTPVSGKADDMQLKVMSYNIRNGQANDGTNSWQMRFPATGIMLKEEMPDIFGVQEAYKYQVEYIAHVMKDYGWYGKGREDGKEEGEFMAIFYNKKKLKMGKKGTFWLSDTPDEPSMGWDAKCKRTATWAIMTEKASKKQFIYVNTHLDHVGQEAREKGLELIVSRIGEMNKKGLPVILTGDFNVTPGNKCLKILENRMVSARKTAEKKNRCTTTYNDWGRIQNQIIDYIYTKGFRCKEFTTHTKRYGEWKYISDHYPISAVLEME